MELGVIQGVEINSEKEPPETIWFIQELMIRSILVDKLKKINFKVSGVLVKEGYQIPDQKQFDHDFKNLLQNIVPKIS
ncbi:hypothetical protein KJA15_02175 [Patescibacteria group bacterium]|nr:hypothetical protein [Patescibacteria group bacterium]